MKILWSKDDDNRAINYDGTEPIIESDRVLIKELSCTCDPPNGCGGCKDIWVKYEIGPKYKYFWRKVTA